MAVKLLIRSGYHIVLALVTVFFATATLAEPLPLWELEGTSNRVLLMGSVHFLRPADYPLADGLQAAYDNADTLIMEIDMDDLDPLAAQSILTGMGVNNSQTLSEAVGASSYAEASELANGIGVPLAMFESFKPWFAALAITQLRMMQLGFDPNWGVETRMTEQARSDGKAILGLETLEEQLGFMDRLDDETQRLFLLQSLQDAVEIEQEVQTIVEAWHAGDTETMEKMLLEGLAEVPSLYDAILVQRNRNWISQIQDLADRPDNYLIIVGTMHLVGENSVLAMLENQGITSRQLSSDDFH